MVGGPVIYATSGWGIHDVRWVQALWDCEFDVHVIGSDGHLNPEVLAAQPAEAPILAGPLDTVAQHLVGLGRPVVGLSWGYDLQQGHAGATSLLELTWLPQLDRIVVDSPSTKEIAESVGMPSESISLIPWGVDLEIFSDVGPVVDFGFPSGSRVVLSLRQHEKLYRTTDVIESFILAAAADPSLCLVMGGEGSLLVSHKDHIRDAGLGDRVRFIGRVTEVEVASLMRTADLYVTASETDGSSVTLLQAMACGLPVIASNIPGNRWWITEGQTGLLFPLGDISTLSGLLREASDRTSQSVRVARARALVVERANWHTNRMQLSSILQF